MPQIPNHQYDHVNQNNQQNYQQQPQNYEQQPQHYEQQPQHYQQPPQNYQQQPPQNYQQQPQQYEQQPQQPQHYQQEQPQFKYLDMSEWPCPNGFKVKPLDAEYISSTMNTWPAKAGVSDTGNSYGGVIIRPFYMPDQNIEADFIDEGDNGGIPTAVGTKRVSNYRCGKCQAYINCYCKFDLDYKRWTCIMCATSNATPSDWLENGITDSQNNFLNTPMWSPSYEFISQNLLPYYKESSTRVYSFGICQSAECRESGAFQDIAHTLISFFTTWEPSPDTLIFFYTYGRHVRLWNFHEEDSEKEPSMIVMNDIENNYMPIPLQDMIFTFHGVKEKLISVLENLENLVGPPENGNCFVDAMHFNTILSYRRPGILMTMFNYGVPDAMKARASEKMSGNKDKLWSTMFEEGVKTSERIKNSSSSLNCYQFSRGFCDLHSFSEFHSICGGRLFHYSNYSSQLNYNKFHQEFIQTMSRQSFWHVQYAVRCSQAYKVAKHNFGFLAHTNTHSHVLHNMDTDSTLTFTLDRRADFFTAEDPEIYVQFACAYYHKSGYPRLRIMTMCRPTSNNPKEICENIDVNPLLKVVNAFAIDVLNGNSLDVAQRCVQEAALEILCEYAASVKRPLVREADYPPNLRHFPDIILGALKSYCWGCHNVIDPDKRTELLTYFAVMPPVHAVKIFLPNMYFLTEILEFPEVGTFHPETGAVIMPSRAPLLKNSLETHSILLVDDGINILLWFGLNTPDEILIDILGTTDIAQRHLFESDILDRGASENDDEFSILNRFWNIVDKCMTDSGFKFNEIQLTIEGSVPSPINYYLRDEQKGVTMAKHEFLQYIQRATAQ